MTLQARKLVVRFDLGEESFKDVGARQVELTGLRVSASVQQSGLPSSAVAQISIWGMPLKLMNQLSRLGKPISYVKENTITLLAASGSDTPTKVFVGTMQSSYADFDDQPDAALHVVAMTAGLDSARPVDPISIRGPVDVAAVMDQIAKSMDRSLLNRGVNTKLPTSYFYGSALKQMRDCARIANINADVDDFSLCIWPVGQSRDESEASLVTISPQTGMIGYPKFTDGGANFRALYQPGINWGSRLNVETSLQPAAGEWIAFMVTYELQSETPGGKWFMTIDATRPNFGNPTS